MEIVIGIKLDNRRSLKAEVLLWRPQIVEESGQRYLRSKQEISSEVREVKSLCLCVTDESRFFVGKTVPQVGGKSLVLQIKDLYMYIYPESPTRLPSLPCDLLLLERRSVTPLFSLIAASMASHAVNKNNEQLERSKEAVVRGLPPRGVIMASIERPTS